MDGACVDQPFLFFFCDGSRGAGSALAIIGRVPRLKRRTVGKPTRKVTPLRHDSTELGAAWYSGSSPPKVAHKAAPAGTFTRWGGDPTDSNRERPLKLYIALLN